jgi:hypothetical protein
MQSIRRVMWSVMLVCAFLFLGCEGDEGSGVLDGAEFAQPFCVYNGQEYNAGDSFASDDGCNSCSCDEDGMVLCTEMACFEGCNFGGVVYEVGDWFPAEDECNECVCLDAGAIACSETDCSSVCTDEDCGPKDEEVAECSDGSPQDWTCVQQDDGNCGWEVSECYAPCDGKTCGDLCDPCPPEGSCEKLAVDYVCGADGMCTTGPANCEVTCEPEDCAVGGGTVELCSDGSPAPMTCEPNENGECGWVAGACYNACAGLSCGDPCVPCDLDDPDCQPEEIAMACDDSGACVLAFDVSDVCGTDLCANVECPSSEAFCEGNYAYSPQYSECDPATGECLEAPGLPPENCADIGAICLDGSCVDTGELSCDAILCEAGTECVDGVCVYAPCQGVPCGGMCIPCDGLDPDCAPVEVPMMCNGAGECVIAFNTVDECGDLCADVECPSSPASCDGDLALSATFSVCDPATGQCLPSAGAPPQDCAAMGMTCENGNCVPKTSETGLCEGTGGSWTECGSGCGPATCANPEPGPICPSVCVPQCLCPEGKTYWDATLGCVSPESCGGESCEPGSEYVADDGCNTCICPDSGLKEGANCTKKFCGDECIPGASYVADDGCNTCICPDSGLKEEAACTLMLCN